MRIGLFRDRLLGERDMNACPRDRRRHRAGRRVGPQHRQGDCAHRAGWRPVVRFNRRSHLGRRCGRNLPATGRAAIDSGRCSRRRTSPVAGEAAGADLGRGQPRRSSRRPQWGRFGRAVHRSIPAGTSSVVGHGPFNRPLAWWTRGLVRGAVPAGQPLPRFHLAEAPRSFVGRRAASAVLPAAGARSGRRVRGRDQRH
jgi:hypothetical protein